MIMIALIMTNIYLSKKDSNILKYYKIHKYNESSK